jgi:hypothetical protein
LACCSDFPSPNFDCCEWFWVEPITAGWLSHTSLPNRQKQSKAFRPNVAADTSSFPNSPSKKAYHELDVGERLAVCYLQINHIRPQKSNSPAEKRFARRTTVKSRQRKHFGSSHHQINLFKIVI